MLHTITRYFTPMLLLALFALPGANLAAQTCRSESEIPASTPDGQFVDHGDGTVSDAKTGLMWAKCAAGLSGSDCTSGSATWHTWQEALELASASNLAGHNDWRLPNIKELRSIVEEQCISPAINQSVFTNTPVSVFWSASPSADFSNYAWSVNFSGGHSYHDGRSDAIRVRLVRGGQ